MKQNLRSRPGDEKCDLDFPSLRLKLKAQAQDSRLKAQGSRLTAQGSRLKAQGSRFKAQAPDLSSNQDKNKYKDHPVGACPMRRKK